MFDPITILVQIAIAIIVTIVAYVLMPKPKGAKPEAVSQMDNPTTDAGRPIPVVFGTVWIKEVNILWFGDKGTNTYEVKA